VNIRAATSDDFEAIWPIFQAVVAAGDTYGYRPDTSKEEAFRLWMESPRQTYVVEVDGRILGTYYLKTNQEGPGAHVCNCGYMVATAARGQGLATLMCEHSQREAIRLGYRAMQFNLVASSNVGAVALWEKLGFAQVGRLPQAFNHPKRGYVDALVMYKWLTG
jgi:L-amino acid N-acyltransferase YncA